MRARGFTLVELMIVVAIIGVLAVVAGTTYSRYSHKARASEVYGMIGEFRAKEEAYRAEYSAYCNSGTACATVNSETAFWPALLSTGEPKLKSAIASLRPAGWLSLGINPASNGLYCGYDAIAGTGTGSMGTYGTAWFSTAAPATGQPWWYIVATCDLDGKSSTNSLWITGSNSNAVHQENEGN